MSERQGKVGEPSARRNCSVVQTVAAAIGPCGRASAGYPRSGGPRRQVVGITTASVRTCVFMGATWYQRAVRSMTGYGRGTARCDSCRATVEIRSVNHRYVDVKLRGTNVEPEIEEVLVAALRKRVERGAFTISVHLEAPLSGALIRVDAQAARQVKEELEALAIELALDDRPSLALICAQPGVLVADTDTAAPTARECALEAMDQALDRLIEMRTVEGNALARDFEARLDHLVALVDDVEGRAGRVPNEVQRRLQERVGRLLQGGKVELDPARLAQEVAILADRHDITEELVRLRSHLEQARAMVLEGGPVGRRLGFLVQELGRELNTVAAKSQSSEIANSVVEAKAELEKLREQVQNIE